MESVRRKLLIFINAIMIAVALLTVFCDRFFFNVERAPVRMIIIEKTSMPHFAFTISSIPLALAAFYKYGERSFAMVPASVDSMQRAFAEAEFIVVGAHGSGGYVIFDDDAWVGPRLLPENSELKHIFFGSCYIYMRRSEWQAQYPKATIIGSDGLTTPFLA